jgi:hypothetical protein
MAAHEGSEHSEHAERRDIGEATLEQLRADVVRLSRNLMTSEPLSMFQEMGRVRSRMYAALDRRLWPRDAGELYLLVAVINCLMAVATSDLGYPDAAAELTRAAWAYAVAIDNRPLMAHLRLEMAGITFWRGRPRQSRDFAEDGLRYLADGPNAAQLHLQYGRAAARLGDNESARQAINAAHDARERDHHDDLLAIGGEFSLSQATHHYLAGSTLTEIPDATSEAIDELERAAEFYEQGWGPGEEPGYGYRALAYVDLAAARLRAGQLDNVSATLEPVLTLPPGQRIDTLLKRLESVRTELARPRYQGSSQARELDERIEDFSRDTITVGLHELPGTLA